MKGARLFRGARLPHLVLLLGVLYTLALQALIPESAFVNGDAALKFLLTRQFANGVLHTDLRLDAPAWAQAAWDEGLFPLSYPNVVVRDGARYPVFPAFFPWLSALPYRFFGFRGLYLLPLLGCWAIWLSALRACRGLRLAGRVSALVLALVVFASPLTFYSATFLEHTPALALAFGGCALWFAAPAPGPSPRAALAGGLLIGIAPLLREELFLFAALAGGWPLLSWKRAGRTALLGLALGSGCVFAWNQVLYGHALGLHALTALSGNAWVQPGRPLAVLRSSLLSLSEHYPVVWFALLGAPWAWVLTRSQRLQRPLLLLAVALVLALATPVLVRSEGGRQWGPRYLLAVIPLAALAAGAALQGLMQRGRAVRAAALTACALCLLSGGLKNGIEGSRYLVANYARRIAPLRMVSAHPARAVAVSHDSVALALAPLFGPQTFFRAEHASELRTLARALQAQGETRFLFLCHTSYPCGPFDDRPEHLELRRAGSGLPLVEFTHLGPVDRYELYEGRVAVPSI